MSAPELHFILSAPRSGSTWLAQALNQHPEIFATENRLFGRFCEMWTNNNGRQSPRMTFDSYARAFSVHYFYDQFADSRDAFIDEFIEEYAQFLMDFSYRKTGKRVIVDKITPYPGTSEIVLAKIKAYFPDAKILQLVRDGRDVATSGAFDWLLKDAVGSDRYRLFVEQQTDLELDRFFDDDLLRKWARNWRETINVFDSETPALKIKYEAMLDDQPRILQQIFAVLGVNDDLELATTAANQVSFERQTGRERGTSNPIAKQRSAIAGDWRNYFTRADGVLFQNAAGPQLVAEGYESGSDWLQSLPQRLSLRVDAATEGESRP